MSFKTTNKLTPEKITNLLMATRHADDLCVPECKDGPSMGRKSRRLDLWTMKRSYTNFATIGYEVKVSRSDFLADNKWQDYLPLCHQLFFVTPWGLVDPSEVPGNVGLIWCSKNLTRCYVKKKAAHREIDLPANLFTYILMSRVNITAKDTNSPGVDKIAHIRDWLDNKKELHELGRQVAFELKRKVSVVERKNAALEKRIASLEHVERFWTESLGCRSSELEGTFSHYLENANRRKAESLALVLTPELRNDLRAAQSHLKAAARAEQSLDDVFEALKEIEKFKP